MFNNSNNVANNRAQAAQAGKMALEAGLKWFRQWRDENPSGRKDAYVKLSVSHVHPRTWEDDEVTITGNDSLQIIIIKKLITVMNNVLHKKGMTGNVKAHIEW